MKGEPVIDMEKALQEKEIMQKHFVREHGFRSSIIELLITHFKEQLKKQRRSKK